MAAMALPAVRLPARLSAVLLAAATCGPVGAQNFNTCRIAATEPYRTEVVAQRGRTCSVELRPLGVSSAQIVTPPTHGRTEIRGANPVLTYVSEPTYVGRDRLVLRASGPAVRTGMWTLAIVVR